jgi:hypothetical protein
MDERVVRGGGMEEVELVYCVGGRGTFVLLFVCLIQSGYSR